MKVIDIAEICHEANRVYCTTLGDHTQPDWFDAPDWQKASAIDGVWFHIENPDAGDESSHENWLDLKASEGWVFGPEKDPEKKTHPCMVPYHDLPEEQRVKDALFRRICQALIPCLEPDQRSVA